MSLGMITLGALALAIVLSCTTRLNVGLLAIALAWVIGVYIADLPLREVTSGFPSICSSRSRASLCCSAKPE